MGAATFKAVLASAVMGALTYWTMAWLQGVADVGRLWGELVVVGGAGLVGLVVYGMLVTLMGVEEVKLIREMIRTRLLGSLTGGEGESIILMESFVGSTRIRGVNGQTSEVSEG